MTTLTEPMPEAFARSRRLILNFADIPKNTPAVANLIRQGKLDQLENTMQSGAALGMKVMDSAIQDLLDKAMITGKDAYKKAINKAKFEHLKDAG